MGFNNDCPICNERDCIVVWVITPKGEKIKKYYFKCRKCEREWH